MISTLANNRDARRRKQDHFHNKLQKHDPCGHFVECPKESCSHKTMVSVSSILAFAGLPIVSLCQKSQNSCATHFHIPTCHWKPFLKEQTRNMSGDHGCLLCAFLISSRSLAYRVMKLLCMSHSVGRTLHRDGSYMRQDGAASSLSSSTLSQSSLSHSTSLSFKYITAVNLLHILPALDRTSPRCTLPHSL